jgi:hypothetical protein
VFSLVRLQAWKIRASVTIAWLAANPIPPMVFPISLVNSLRFDKSSARCPRKLVGAVATPVSDAPGSDFLAPDRAGQPTSIEGRRRYMWPAADPVGLARLRPLGRRSRWTGFARVRLCIAQENLAATLKTSNPALFRKPFLIIWKPRPPTLIPQLCPAWGGGGNLFVNSVLARMADCQPAERNEPLAGF